MSFHHSFRANRPVTLLEYVISIDLLCFGCLWHRSDAFENPVIQQHYRNLEALALDMVAPEETDDLISKMEKTRHPGCCQQLLVFSFSHLLYFCFTFPVPKVEQMDIRLGPLIDEFKNMVYPFNYNPDVKPAAKRKTGKKKRQFVKFLFIKESLLCLTLLFFTCSRWWRWIWEKAKSGGVRGGAKEPHEERYHWKTDRAATERRLQAVWDSRRRVQEARTYWRSCCTSGFMMKICSHSTVNGF